MSRTDLDTRDLLESIHQGVGHLLGKPVPPITPALLSRHWTVFQIPSASTPNHFYLVAGSKKDGWICTCLGWQSSNKCYHVSTVAEVMRTTKRHRATGGPSPREARGRMRGNSPRYIGAKSRGKR